MDKNRDNSAHNQERVGFMTNSGWDSLLVQVNQQIEEFENHPLPEVKDKVFSLLESIDLIHRESLGRLVSLFKEGVLEQVVSDPPIHTLMELYDLLPPEPEAEVSEFEIDKNGFPSIPVEMNFAPKKSPPVAPKYPRWIPVSDGYESVQPNTTQIVDVDGTQVLLCRVRDEYFALEPTCEQDGASLSGASISQYTLTCATHSGCHYDIRQGTRIGASGSIKCYPVEVGKQDKNRVMIGLDMEFVPTLPVS